jgi:hypothetical protein
MHSQQAVAPSRLLFIIIGLLILIEFPTWLHAQDTPGPSKKKVDYSPYPEQTFPNRVFFGDTHLHTAFSADAGMIGNILGPEEAYRFARGETVTSSMGLPAKLQRPLDFLVVADHAENLGLAPLLAEHDPALLKTEFGAKVHALLAAGDPVSAFGLWQKAKATGKDPLAGRNDIARGIWARITEAAESYNQPGLFTTLIGFEWTSAPGTCNLHRNIIFRDGKDKAGTIIPISAYDSEDPEDLWRWMNAYEDNTGGRVLAIPHNGNLSNGLMFDEVTLAGKKPLDRDYSRRRARWEPLYEVTQMKGDGETHPLLSVGDEFADFETWDKGSLGPPPKTPDMLPREYARAALKRGLKYEADLGGNPFRFGMIGSTDAHTSLATTRENNFFGKVTLLEPTADPIRFEEAVGGQGGEQSVKQYAWQTSASGLAAVWARENTREALWDAMSRKEVYATTGTRIRVRVFAGWDFKASDLDRSDFAKHGYDQGVPMGGRLASAPGEKAPAFLVRAIRDADGANLDRVQMVKGWLDAKGNTHERIYDLAVSDDREIATDGRCKTPVGNTVNIQEATYTNAIGDPFLQAFWIDPDFNPRQHAFYYVRVLEIPTPRWTTYDARAFGVMIPKEVPASIQDRAYTSPIWYAPQKPGYDGKPVFK